MTCIFDFIAKKLTERVYNKCNILQLFTKVNYTTLYISVTLVFIQTFQFFDTKYISRKRYLKKGHCLTFLAECLWIVDKAKNLKMLEKNVKAALRFSQKILIKFRINCELIQQ